MKGSYADRLLLKYRDSGALIDSNLLLLYFVGKYDANRIQHFKRTKVFTREDFHLLEAMFRFFKRIVTTPNILTEVSNLSWKLAKETKSDYSARFAEQVSLLQEDYCASTKACGHPFFSKSGLTDAAIMELSAGKYVVITDDFPLSKFLEKMDIPVLNFNHLRTAALLKRVR